MAHKGLLLNAGLDNLELHHIVVNSWEHGVDAEQNVVLISIASVMDPNLAPKGKHTLHAYTPATEPFELWQNLTRGSKEYEKLKEERSQVLWRAVEKVIPDIRDRLEVEMVGHLSGWDCCNLCQCLWVVPSTTFTSSCYSSV